VLCCVVLLCCVVFCFLVLLRFASLLFVSFILSFLSCLGRIFVAVLFLSFFLATYWSLFFDFEMVV
jgi:hypothetical protein